jgi:hypothetical protein
MHEFTEIRVESSPTMKITTPLSDSAFSRILFIMSLKLGTDSGGGGWTPSVMDFLFGR